MIERAGRPSVPGGAPADRAILLARWLHLTRRILPGMAAEQRWPIRLDHCFMRVCLDAAFGAPWTATLEPPAVRHMTGDELAAAIGVAERIVGDPAALPALDRASLDGRRAARRRGRP